MRLRARSRVAVITAVVMTLAPPGAAMAAPLAPTSPFTPIGPADVPTSQQLSPTTDAAPQSKHVTLITGDEIDVTIDGSGQVTAEPGRIRDKMRFVSRMVKGNRQVIPVDALPLVASGQLDESLFDVTQLIAQGYDNAASADLPLIVGYTKESPALSTMAVTRRMPDARMVSVLQHRDAATTTWDSLTTRGADGQRSLGDGIGKIWLDAKVKLSLEQSVPQIGGPVAWSAGVTGTGMTIGLIDSGVDDTHPDLAGKVVDRQDFTTEADNLDHLGHGTHVASTMVGTGAASDGKYRGVAPDAKLYSAKVCTRDDRCETSAIIAGMEWIAKQGVKAANMSLGGGNEPGLDPLEQTLETLTARYGTLFVVATGNQAGWTSSPASAPSALAVGAVDKQDQIAPFSNRGMIPEDLAVKPELVAPGVAITAARSKDSAGSGSYTAKSGTSMATPHVTASAALLAQKHPDWTHDQLKDALVSTTKDAKADWFSEGAGRVDVGRAVTQSVYASPSTLSFGDLPWPHDDSQKASKVVTYHNPGPAPVTLNLTLATSAADGTALPAGAFTVSPSSVTVSAGGSAPVTVSSDPTVDSPVGTFLGGTLAATATTGDVTVRTAMTVVKDAETHTLTVTSLDRDGKPTPRSYGWLYDESTGLGRMPVYPDQNGVAKINVRAGTYALDTMVYGTDSSTTLLVYPVVKMDRDQSITLDARVGKPMTVAKPQPDATLVRAHVGFTMGTASGWWLGDILIASSFDGWYTGQAGPDDAAGNVLGDALAVFAKIGPDGTALDSPYVYNLAWFTPKGSFFTGFDKTFAPKDLAEVRNTYGSPQGRAVGENQTTTRYKPSWDRNRGFGGSSSITLPTARTEYYSTGSDIMWDASLDSKGLLADGSTAYLAGHHEPYTTLKAGKRIDRVWNQGVFGPGFRTDPPNSPVAGDVADGIYRTGDRLWMLPSLYGDSASRGSGSGSATKAHLTLTADGTTLVDKDVVGGAFDVPAGDAAYRLSITSDRSAFPDIVSSSVDTTWTFRSGHVDKTKNLPVSAVRFTPPLDQSNAAPANAFFPVPFEVQRQPDSAAAAAKKVDLQVSYDDGKTWAKATFVCNGGKGIAFVKNPASGYVSFKASATDAAGNSVSQTIIRAYRVK